MDYSSWGRKESNMTEQLSLSFWGLCLLRDLGVGPMPVLTVKSPNADVSVILECQLLCACSHPDSPVGPLDRLDNHPKLSVPGTRWGLMPWSVLFSAARCRFRMG